MIVKKDGMSFNNYLFLCTDLCVIRKQLYTPEKYTVNETKGVINIVPLDDNYLSELIGNVGELFWLLCKRYDKLIFSPNSGMDSILKRLIKNHNFMDSLHSIGYTYIGFIDGHYVFEKNITNYYIT